MCNNTNALQLNIVKWRDDGIEDDISVKAIHWIKFVFVVFNKALKLVSLLTLSLSLSLSLSRTHYPVLIFFFKSFNLSQPNSVTNA